MMNPLSKPYRVYTQIALREADLSNGEGFEPIGVRITETPNYTVKNRHCFIYGIIWRIKLSVLVVDSKLR